jgi:hypothetical protein
MTVFCNSSSQDIDRLLILRHPARPASPSCCVKPSFNPKRSGPSFLVRQPTLDSGGSGKLGLLIGRLKVRFLPGSLTDSANSRRRSLERPRRVA